MEKTRGLNKIHKTVYWGRNYREARKFAAGDAGFIDEHVRKLTSLKFKRQRPAGYVEWIDGPVKEYEATFERVQALDGELNKALELANEATIMKQSKTKLKEMAQALGKRGGETTHKKYGKAHYSAIGKRGMEKRWKKRGDEMNTPNRYRRFCKTHNYTGEVLKVILAIIVCLFLCME